MRNPDIILSFIALTLMSFLLHRSNAQTGSQPAAKGFPFTVGGQFDMMKAITHAMKEGGGSGVVYWEGAWITSAIKDQWGQGSSWENCALFDFQGNVMESIDFMKYNYKK